MKITVNKAKIKKLMNFAEKSDSIGTKALFFCAGNVWAAKGGTLISTSYKIEEGEELKIPFSVKIEKIKKIIDKAPEVNKGEIQIDFYEIESESLCNRAIGYLERMTNAETVAEIDRMFYALIAPKSRSESVNIMVTDKQVKAELIDHYKFVGGVEIEQKNNLAAPLLFYLSDDVIFPLSKKQSEKYSIVRESDYQYKEDEGYYLKYESTNGTTYQALHYKGEKAKFYSDEIKNAFKLAIEQMKEQSDLATEPEPIENEPVKPTESEESKMQEKKEIEPTEPTMEKPAAEPIQNEEIQTSEPTTEPTAATAAESTSEPEKENRPPIVSKAAPDVSEIIELFRNFDDYSAHHALEELFQKEQAKKGFLYFSEIIEICKAINAGAWNTFFYCRPMHFGATLSESPEPGARVIVSDSVYSFENRLGYSEEERAEKCKICGNANWAGGKLPAMEGGFNTMEDYITMKQRHQNEIDAFPFGCAFNEWQYKKMMEGWGLDPEADKDKIARVFSGTFVKKSDLEAFREMMSRHDAELKAAFAADKTGEGFIYNALKYELANHEYYYSGELSPVLAALGLRQSDVDQDEKLKNALEKAERDYMCEMSRAEDEMFDPLAK